MFERKEEKESQGKLGMGMFTLFLIALPKHPS